MGVGLGDLPIGVVGIERPGLRDFGNEGIRIVRKSILLPPFGVGLTVAGRIPVSKPNDTTFWFSSGMLEPCRCARISRRAIFRLTQALFCAKMCILLEVYGFVCKRKTK